VRVLRRHPQALRSAATLDDSRVVLLRTVRYQTEPWAPAGYSGPVILKRQNVQVRHPLAQPSVRPAPPPATGEPAPLSILVVDADPGTRAVYRESFALSGSTVVEASDGREALAKALSDPPAIVVTALNLPLIDGYALCEILRRDPATANVPILVITGESRRAADRALSLGADAVVLKPSTPEFILAETRRLIADARELRGRAATARAGASQQRAHSAQRQGRLSKTFARFTTKTPPATAPDLMCPSCERPLTYEHSFVGGVSERYPEQWDHYACSTCGAFQYRHRTRALRRVEA
jgi:CheY-like chemotaxis protein